MAIFRLYLTFAFTFFACSAHAKRYLGGQRIFAHTVRAIDLIDSSMHGFHIILDEDFLRTHLQPVHTPTVYASAVALQSSPLLGYASEPSSYSKNDSSKALEQKKHSKPKGALRVTEILYPENGLHQEEGGLLDGKIIKLNDLRENTWYYVCVEYESSLRRHEPVTGVECQIKRTLDKFGHPVNSTVTDMRKPEIDDRSLIFRFSINTDFPIRLEISLQNESKDTDKENMDSAIFTLPIQSYIVRKSQAMKVIFDQSIYPDTLYGKLCIWEEPLTNAFTAMGRPIRNTMEKCYFDALKTKPASKRQEWWHENAVRDSAAQAQIRQKSHYARSYGNGNGAGSIFPYGFAVILATFALRLF